MRAEGAAIVLCIFMLLLALGGAFDHWWRGPSICLILITAAPVSYLFWAPVGILAGSVGRRMNWPWLGLFVLPGLFCVCPGDPVVFILHKQYPHLVPVQRFQFLTVSLVIWVHN